MPASLALGLIGNGAISALIAPARTEPSYEHGSVQASAAAAEWDTRP